RGPGRGGAAPSAVDCGAAGAALGATGTPVASRVAPLTITGSPALSPRVTSTSAPVAGATSTTTSCALPSFTVNTFVTPANVTTASRGTETTASCLRVSTRAR